MNETNRNTEDSRLGRLLRTWRVEAEVPPRFAEGVWRRIEREEGRADPAPAGWWRWLSGLAEAAVRPSFVAGYLALVLLLGAGAGFVSGHARSRGAEGDLKGRYVQSVDPFFASAR